MEPEWLIFAYKLPNEPTRSRTYIWRQLKQLGAAYVHQSFWALPKLPELAEAMARLEGKITEFSGESSLLSSFVGTEWEAKVRAQMSTSRDEEYDEVCENIERLNHEISREAAAGKFNFAELEDVESDFEKISSWLERIKARDYFRAPQGKEAVSQLAAVRLRVETFAAKVHQLEGLLDPQAKSEASDAPG